MKKISTGIKKLDKIIGGGLLPRSSTLLAGAPGSGKTTFCLQFLHQAAISSGLTGILVTFEEFPEIIYRDALSLGWDLRRLEDRNQLKIIFTSPDILIEEIEKEGGLFDKIITDIRPEVIAFDSISYLDILFKEPEDLRNHYNILLNSCKRLDLTAYYTYDVSKLFGQENLLNSPIAFIVDNVIYLQYVEIESQINLALVALKIRGSEHNQEILNYQIGENGIEILNKFKGRENILTGSSRTIFSSEE